MARRPRPRVPHRLTSEKGGGAGCTDSTADPLLTHVMPLEPGVGHLNRIIGDRTRTVDSELVMRLVIDLENHPAHHGSRQP